MKAFVQFSSLLLSFSFSVISLSRAETHACRTTFRIPIYVVIKTSSLPGPRRLTLEYIEQERGFSAKLGFDPNSSGYRQALEGAEQTLRIFRLNYEAEEIRKKHPSLLEAKIAYFNLDPENLMVAVDRELLLKLMTETYPPVMTSVAIFDPTLAAQPALLWSEIQTPGQSQNPTSLWQRLKKALSRD